MHYNATVLRGQCIDIKVIDEELLHRFEIWSDSVKYEVSRYCGRDIIARPTAELMEMQDDKVLIRTASHCFEIVKVQGPNGIWQAYKSLRN